jgi:hypothetical protein
MEGMEHLLLTKDGLSDDPVFSYSLTQLRHHEEAKALLTNPPPEGAERWIWSRWHQNELFHVDAIYQLMLDVRASIDSNPPLAQVGHPAAQADSNPPLAQVGHPAPPVVVDTSQLEYTPTPRAASDPDGHHR